MTSNKKFEIRFMLPHEAKRVAELVRSLQEYQQKKDCTRLPKEDDFLRELVHIDGNGNIIANNNGTFTAVAIDLEKLNELDYRRCGLGQKLVQFMRQHGQPFGHNGFDVPFMNNNMAGQSFYKKLGAYLVNEDYQLVGIEL